MSLLEKIELKGRRTFSTSAKQPATSELSSDLGQEKSPGKRDLGRTVRGVKVVLFLGHILDAGSERRALDPDKDIEWLYLIEKD